MRQIKPIFMQNAFRMALPSLTTSLEHILDDFLIWTEMCSKVVLRLVGAILNAFCLNMGLICHILAEIEIFRKCTKIRSVSGECFAPICAHVSRRHVNSAISLFYWF